MNKLHKKVFIALIILLVFGILVVFVFDVSCIFKSIFHIACPGCGLTRGFRALFRLDIKEAVSYNILTIPIFLFLIITSIIFIVDLISKKNLLEKYFNFFTNKLIVLIIVFISIIAMILNNIHGI